MRRSAVRLGATLALLTLVSGVSSQIGAQEEPSPPGSDLRVWLVTIGPGDIYWERYGHNAIRVLDERTGRDVSYNWGIFDIQQQGFIPRFLRGRMLYMMAAFPTDAMVDAYTRANREIVMQELSLSPEQKLELQSLAEINARPENRDYLYQYFLDNCSTRVRDLLDRVLGGQLMQTFSTRETEASFRYHTRRLGAIDPLISTGIDLLLGTPTDRPITVWEEMFIPMTLRDELRGIQVTTSDGTSQPLVLTEEVVASATRPPEPTEPPLRWPVFLLLGVLTGGLLAAGGLEQARENTALQRASTIVAASWCCLAGVLGTILVFLLFTDHTFAYWNENLFLFHPLLLALVMPVSRSRGSKLWARRTQRVSAAVVVIAIAGLLWQVLPISTHDNGWAFALALPIHLGLWAGFGRKEAQTQRNEATV